MPSCQVSFPLMPNCCLQLVYQLGRAALLLQQVVSTIALLRPPRLMCLQPTTAALAVPACPADVAVQIESDKVAGVRREIAEVDAQLARAQRLLKIADPDGCAAPVS
jgi:hypothetical protein